MTLLRIIFLVFVDCANKFSRFVQFGADQDCFCGAVGCRRKLGVKPNKPKMPSSDAALKLVARQVAASSPKVKAMLFGRNVCYCGPFSCQVLGYEVAPNLRLIPQSPLVVYCLLGPCCLCSQLNVLFKT